MSEKVERLQEAVILKRIQIHLDTNLSVRSESGVNILKYDRSNRMKGIRSAT